ncbi:MAG: glycine/betaine ABC transporter permease, partial [Pseudomonadota bacterium]
MADVATNSDPAAVVQRGTGLRAMLEDKTVARGIFWALLGVAAVLTVLRPWLPDGLVRIPEVLLLPWRDWIDAAFQLIAFDLGFIHVTRFLSGILEFVLDAVANILYGRARWPRFEALPWTVIASGAAILGYALGGWRLALLAGGTFVWAALIGQWKWTMETMSVITLIVSMVH